MSYPVQVANSPWPRNPDYPPRRLTAINNIPLALEEALARQWCHLTEFDQADVLEFAIRSAQTQLEGDDGALGLILTSQEWVQDFNAFGNPMWLVHWPIQEISSVVYHDEDDIETTVPDTTYELRQDVFDSYVALAAGQEWPTSVSSTKRVQVTYVAGYGPAALVPPNIKQAIAMKVAQSFDKRDAVGWDETFRQLLLTVFRRNV